MDTIRFAFFVDGSNLFGSMKKLGVQIQDYSKFYRFLFEKCAEQWKQTLLKPTDVEGMISRIYWYEMGSIDTWDLNNSKAVQSLKEAFGKNHEIKRYYLALAGQQFQGAEQAQVFEEAWKICFGEIQPWYLQKTQSLEGIKKFHHGVLTETDFIEIIECGHWKVDMLSRSVEEKGLDTRLAVDMVTKKMQYDVAILVSGDADAIPSLNFVKQEGKHVGVIEFIKGYPPETRGRQFSSRLKIAADFVPQIYEMDLVSKGIAAQT